MWIKKYVSISPPGLILVLNKTWTQVFSLTTGQSQRCMKILPMSVILSQHNCISYANIIIGLLRLWYKSVASGIWLMLWQLNLPVQEIEGAVWSNFKPTDQTGGWIVCPQNSLETQDCDLDWKYSLCRRHQFGEDGLGWALNPIWQVSL